MTDSCTGVVFYIFVVAFLATVNSFNYKERKEKNGDVYSLLIISKEDNRPFLCTMATLYTVLLPPEFFSLFFSSCLNLVVQNKSPHLHKKAIPSTVIVVKLCYRANGLMPPPKRSTLLQVFKKSFLLFTDVIDKGYPMTKYVRSLSNGFLYALEAFLVILELP